MPRIPGTGVYEQPAPDVITATTIESTVYNAFVNDVETDLNLPRPITSGGTGASTAAEATTNLKAVSYGGAQTLTDAEKLVARTNIAAVPFDAMAYSGMQVNGSFEVSQERGGTGTGTDGQYICDGYRLTMGVTGAVILVNQAVFNFIPGFTKGIAAGVTTAKVSLVGTDFALIAHLIEGYRVSRLGWGTAGALPLTIAFWTTHSPAGTYTIAIRNTAGTYSYMATYTQNASNGVEYKVITIPPPPNGSVWNSDHLSGIWVQFVLASGGTYNSPAANTWYNTNYVAAPGQVNAVSSTSNAVRLTGVVVLPGTQAPTAAQSPLIMRPYDQELVTCQRYWEKSDGASTTRFHGNVTSAVSYGAAISFKQIKRVNPTVILTNFFASGFPTAVGTTGIGMNGFYEERTANATQNGALFTSSWTADARL